MQKTCKGGGVTDRWIVIPKWDEFQHYKDRDPKWIKNYNRLLNDHDYLSLSFRLRGLLHGIWLLYAASGQKLGSSPAQLGRMLGEESVRTRDLIALNHAGFIEFSASPPLARRLPRLRDREEKTLSANAPQAEAFAAKVVADPKGREHRPYDNPSDPAAAIRRMISNGAITTVIELEAELRALNVNGAAAESLQALFT
jgi:hypothetical protein